MKDSKVRKIVVSSKRYAFVNQTPHSEYEILLTVVSQITGTQYTQVFPIYRPEELRMRVLLWLNKITATREPVYQQRLSDAPTGDLRQGLPPSIDPAS